MAQKTGGMTSEDRGRTADLQTSVKTSGTPWGENEEDTDRMRAEVRQLEEDLAVNLSALRYKLSPTTMKMRAKEELRELAVNKPRAALNTAGHTGGDLLRRFLETSREQPIIPVAISAIVVGVAALRRLLRGL
jgi:hypothetical protein